MRKHLPVYLHSAGYAKEYHETEYYQMSFRLNVKCRDAIQEAIDSHYQNDRLNEAAVHEVVEQFGYERTMVLLANTVIQKEWDGRFSPENREWAHMIPAPCDMLGDRGKRFMIDKVHPGLVDLFITQVRREHERAIGRRPSVKTALKENSAQAAAEPKPHKKSEQSL
ncbi:MAG: DUF3849 domain-containing protein [Ruminococcus sp.]|nr:DUF3849 domain-containing protein [Ruminococcus sp.]